MIKLKYLLWITTLSLIYTTNLYADDSHFCDGCGGKCGTHLLFTPEGREKLQRTLFMDGDVPKVGHKSVISPKNIFKVYYDTVGYHAPPMADLNRNGIPDYVDSVCFYFDFVYDYYINQLGFRSPYPDNGGRGSDHFDVFLYDLGDSDSDTSPNYSIGGTYGLTNSASYDFISSEPFPRFYSYIVIDNDFAATDSIRQKGMKSVPAFRYPGIPSLKVTAAHEFFHAIQFMYGLSDPTTTTIMEMTAVAMERVLFPEVKDYLQYVRGLFANPASYPFGLDNAFTGYGHSIFNQYLIENFGVEIMRLLWENVSEGFELYSALDLALQSYDSNLKTAWNEFLIWAYYTGNRSKKQSFFSNAAELPEINPFRIIDFSPPTGTTSGNLSPFEFRMLRFFFPASGEVTDDTLDVILGNIDLDAASRQLSINRNYFWQVSDSQIPNSMKIPLINYFENYQIDTNLITFQSIVSPGSSTIEIAHSYPNPFRNSVDEYLQFPAPKGSEVYSKVQLSVYDSEMRQVFYKELPVTVNNRNKVVVWSNIPSNIASGTYIFAVKSGDEITMGKFAIIND